MPIPGNEPSSVILDQAYIKSKVDNDGPIVSKQAEAKREI